MIKAARADTGLDPKTSKNQPFWKSTQLIAKNLKMPKAGLAAKSNDFFKGIAEARQAEEQLKVDWELTDSKNSQVIENGKKLGHAIALLRTDFSKEAARKKNGRELTAKEKAEFDKIKAQQKAVSTGWQPARRVRLAAANLSSGGQGCLTSVYVPLSQFGFRFSLKAVIPSRASSDSRACM